MGLPSLAAFAGVGSTSTAAGVVDLEEMTGSTARVVISVVVSSDVTRVTGAVAMSVVTSGWIRLVTSGHKVHLISSSLTSYIDRMNTHTCWTKVHVVTSRCLWIY